ncbi:MAG: hypothetical protein RJA98_1749 [Pseudomonadota bacterium]|jgi:hypothetical protein
MSFALLSQIRQRVVVGAPLPFNIRDSDRTLLLARGQIVASVGQLEALLARGVLVDMDELMSPTARVRAARPEELPEMWRGCMAQVNSVLQDQSGQEGFLDALTEASAPVLALVERDKDLAIFQLLRQEGNAHVQHGVNHSAHTAITAYLTAQRLGWSADDAERAFKVGLTMNISMLELQGQLAVQGTPPTDEQRQAIDAHPEFSRRMLEIAGVTDGEWLRAVSEHHETPDMNGYPQGLRASCETAELVRRADIYMSKLSPRNNRTALGADKAGRAMFMQEPGHPMISALVKEFGVYPPGCWVRLHSGETGLVIQRGSTVMAPIVAVMTTAAGVPLEQPLRRDTERPGNGVQTVISAPETPIRLQPELLMKLTTRAAA